MTGGAPVGGEKTRAGGLCVLVVTTWLPTVSAPATGVFVRRDIEALSRVADVRVLHLVPPGHADRDRRHLIGGVPVWEVPMSPRDPLSVARALPEVSAALAGADVLHSMAVSSLMPLALVRPDLPWVHTEHWSAFAGRATGARGVALRGIARAERLPDVVTAVSPDLAARLARLAGRDVCVVPNIVDAPPPTPRRRLAPTDVLEVVGVGGLIPRKRPLVAVDTVAELLARGRAAHLTWVGAGPLEGEVRARARLLGVPLTLTGVLPPEEVPGVLAASDVFLVPSLRETFFLGAAEALGAGRPVVVGASGGPGAFVAPPSGRMVDSADPRAFADAVEAVMEETRDLDAHDIARAVEAFTPRALAGAYADLHRRARMLHAGRGSRGAGMGG